MWMKRTTIFHLITILPMRHISVIALSLVVIIHFGCTKSTTDSTLPKLVDANATLETKALWHNMNELRTTHTMFGHEDDLAYGVFWAYEAGRSDVKEVSGSYPAVYGWDVGWIELDSTSNLDYVPFDAMRSFIKEAHSRGGINTISWHLNNPYNGASSWDTTKTVVHLLPGGESHDTFNLYLDRLANFLGSLQDDNGIAIPIIFRPWHEHTGHWFWWSARYTDGDEYVRLWQYTVRYLRDVKGINHLLYAYSPSNSGIETMWDSYPGDEWVDIIGFDDYFSYMGGDDEVSRADAKANDLQRFTGLIEMIVTEAERRGKIPAITETGLEAVRDSTWFTSFLLNAINANDVTRRMSYVLVWRNSNDATDRKEHFYAPYSGHSSANDFLKFTQDPSIMLESGLPNMFVMPKK